MRSLIGFSGGSDGKESSCNAGDLVQSLVGKIPWRAWQLTPVFLPGEFHGQRSLAGYNPCSCKKSGTTEQLTLWEKKKEFAYMLRIDFGLLALSIQLVGLGAQGIL